MENLLDLMRRAPLVSGVPFFGGMAQRYEESTMQKELRNSMRVFVRLEVEISTTGMNLHSTKTRDLSENGVFVYATGRFSLGESCQVNLLLRKGESTNNVNVEAKVVRIDNEGLALRFTEGNHEAHERLRQLVLLNSGEPQKERGEHRLGS